MGEYQEDVDRGKAAFEAWIRERFPDADLISLGHQGWDYERWTIDFGPGKAALRIGTTERVLESPLILKERIRDLERLRFLEDAAEKSKWLVLTTVGVAAKHPDEW
jgi:hypothetical protein